MEAAHSLGVIENELKNHDARISSLHGRLGEVQVQQANQQTEIKVVAKEVEEARADIDESKKELRKAISDVQVSFDKKFESLTNAVRWGTGSMIALIGVLLTILLQGH